MGWATPLNDHDIDGECGALALVQIPRNAEVIHHVVVAVQTGEEGAVLLAVVGLGSGLPVAGFIREGSAENQHGPAVIFHRPQGLEGNGMVNLGGEIIPRGGPTADRPLLTLPGRILEGAKGWIGNDHIDGAG